MVCLGLDVPHGKSSIKVFFESVEEVRKKEKPSRRRRRKRKKEREVQLNTKRKKQEEPLVLLVLIIGDSMLCCGRRKVIISPFITRHFVIPSKRKYTRRGTNWSECSFRPLLAEVWKEFVPNPRKGLKVVWGYDLESLGGSDWRSEEVSGSINAEPGNAPVERSLYG